MTAAYPLHWPDGLARTKNRATSQFKTQLSAALTNVRKSLEAFGRDSGKAVTGIVLSSNVTLGENTPADSGVAAWFVWDGEQRCIAVDRYPKVQDNLQAIHHIVEARRTEMRHGGLHVVRQTFKGFVALPAPAAGQWRSFFGFGETEPVGMSEVEGRFRSKAATAHPDKGGSETAMMELNAMRAAAKRELA
ncbi:J domain-containing protein [Sphingomonas sp. NBWT7]|uniref:J domain-containing protein n=1 Tax=Sphingomonas sp. NBWT7 TaxID=2596913 RepID=UPI002156192E|nr:J domain-containing protein [Sphingomonas sp. NBWT7]